MRHSISDTAEWGDYVSGPRVIDDGTRETMRQLLTEIQDGSFAKRWIAEADGRFHDFLAARGALVPARGGGPGAADDDAVAAQRGEGAAVVSDPDVVRFFDTTLRDGEQAPGSR